jgi:hypothetical protein
VVFYIVPKDRLPRPCSNKDNEPYQEWAYRNKKSGEKDEYIFAVHSYIKALAKRKRHPVE